MNEEERTRLLELAQDIIRGLTDPNISAHGMPFKVELVFHFKSAIVTHTIVIEASDDA